MTREALKLGPAFGIPIALLFGVSGRWDWIAGWVYLGILALGVAAAMLVIARFQPELLEERRTHWRDGKPWDRPLLGTVALGPIVVQLVCGLDMRFGWSHGVTSVQQVTAAAAAVAGVALTAWAMAVNRFFSAVIRIQTDRGHTVVSVGPYRYVRHPGYTGMLLVTLGGPILLGTLWGLVPAATVAGALVLRAALEDRTLRSELAGYEEYATRVRYRLIPGVW